MMKVMLGLASNITIEAALQRPLICLVVVAEKL